jgi:hypothetical protein
VGIKIIFKSLAKVDLPEPLCPRTATYSPSLIDKVTFESAGISFDLSRLDFNSISFALPFGQPYERRAFERRFLSSIFFCKSSDAAELCIRGIYATYAKWS